MLHKLLERKDIVKKTSYQHRKLIETLFSAVKELLELANITGNLYTQHQAANIASVIIYRTGEFLLAIFE